MVLVDNKSTVFVGPVLLQVLLWAELRGNSQGVRKIPAGALLRSDDARPLNLVHETTVSASIDGGQQLGMIILHSATTLAISKARLGGVGLVGTFNTSSSTGALG